MKEINHSAQQNTDISLDTCFFSSRFGSMLLGLATLLPLHNNEESRLQNNKPVTAAVSTDILSFQDDNNPKQADKYKIISSDGDIIRSFQLNDSQRIYNCNAHNMTVEFFSADIIPNTLALIKSLGYGEPPLNVEISSSGYISYTDPSSGEPVLATARFVLKEIPNEDDSKDYIGHLADGTKVQAYKYSEEPDKQTLRFRSLAQEKTIYEEVLEYDKKQSFTGALCADYEFGITKTYGQTWQLILTKVIDPNKFISNFPAIENEDKYDLLLNIARAAPNYIYNNLEKLKFLPIDRYEDLIKNAISNRSPAFLTKLKIIIDNISNPDVLDDLVGKQMRRERALFSSMPESDLMLFTKWIDFEIGKIQVANSLTRQENLKTRISEFQALKLFDHPAAQTYFKISENWIDWNSNTARALLDPPNLQLSKNELRWLSAICLHNEQKEASPESVNQALQKILELRNMYSDLDMIKGRNIVYLSHSETLIQDSGFIFHECYVSTGDHHKFGKSALLESIRQKQGTQNTLTHIRPEFDQIHDIDGLQKVLERLCLTALDQAAIIQRLKEIQAEKNEPPVLIDLLKLVQDSTAPSLHEAFSKEIIAHVRGDQAKRLEVLQEKKQQVLDAIINTEGPMTLIVDSHGGPDSLYLSGGAIIGPDGLPVDDEYTVKITTAEIAEAYKQRMLNFPEETEIALRPVAIFVACFSNNFMTELGHKLQGQQPIMAGQSEYNQVGFSALPSKYGNLFLPYIIGTATELEEDGTTIKDLIRRQHIDLEVQTPDSNGETGERLNLNTNPSIFVPAPDGTLHQIGAIWNKCSGSV